MAKNDYCVIGLGRFGSEVAKQLNANNKHVMVLDRDPSLIQKASKIYEIAIACDTSDINSLNETGVINTKTVIVAISEIESSIMTCANLKEIGVKDIVAKAINPVHKRVLKTMGIQRVVIPEIEVADKVAMQCLYNIGIDVISTGNGFSWIKISVNNKNIIGQSLEKLEIRNKFDTNLILIDRAGKIIFPLTKDTIIEYGDVVTIMSKTDKMDSVIKFFNRNEKQH